MSAAVNIVRGETKRWRRYLKGRARRTAYRTFFSSESGNEVLRDLSKFCCAMAPTYEPKDPNHTAYNEGARAVWLHIVSQIDVDESKLAELARKPDE